MNKFEEFQKKYPNLFRIPPSCGFDLSPGWETLVDTLCGVLEGYIKQMSEEERENSFCDQIKEKFGGLRFYISQGTEAMYGAIAMAEDMSFHICETCGKPGQRRSGGWILTLCDEHHEANQKARGKK